MQCIVAQLFVKPECAEEYEAEFAKGAKIVQDNEEGCLLYQLAKDRKEKGKYYVLEVYASGDAVKTHMKNLGKNRNPAMGKLMDTSKKPVISVMPVIGNPVSKVNSIPPKPIKDILSLTRITYSYAIRSTGTKNGHAYNCYPC